MQELAIRSGRPRGLIKTVGLWLIHLFVLLQFSATVAPA